MALPQGAGRTGTRRPPRATIVSFPAVAIRGPVRITLALGPGTSLTSVATNSPLPSKPIATDAAGGPHASATRPPRAVRSPCRPAAPTSPDPTERPAPAPATAASAQAMTSCVMLPWLVVPRSQLGSVDTPSVPHGTLGCLPEPGVIEKTGPSLWIALADQPLHGWDLAKATAQANDHARRIGACRVQDDSRSLHRRPAQRCDQTRSRPRRLASGHAASRTPVAIRRSDSPRAQTPFNASMMGTTVSIAVPKPKEK
jgi:hypothetical protein